MFALLFLSQLFLSPFALAAPPDPAASVPTEKLIASFLEGGQPALQPKLWSNELKREEIDINELTGSHFEDGRAYGAVAYRKVDLSFTQVRKALSQPGLILKLVNHVKTLSDSRKLESPTNTDSEFAIATAIKVPVLANFHTHVKLRLSAPSEKRLLLDWRQVDDFGELSYNQGVAILEPDGETSKLTVIGVHIIKNEDRIPWLGRGTAHTFAKTHYGNFVEALQTTLETQEMN